MPESVISLDGYLITLNGTEAIGFNGTYEADIILDIPDYEVTFVQSFSFYIG